MEHIEVLHLLPGSMTARRLTVEPVLASYQQLLGGDPEALALAGGGTVYIDEEGTGRSLPRNVAVELLFEAAGQRLLPGDVINGPAVVTGGFGADGEDVAVTARIVALCARAGIGVVAG